MELITKDFIFGPSSKAYVNSIIIIITIRDQRLIFNLPLAIYIYIYIMDEKARWRIQLDCLYEMFRDRIEENVIYIVYSENEGKIDATIDQLMPIANSSFTGHNFDPKPPLLQSCNNLQGGRKIFNSETRAMVNNGLTSPRVVQDLQCANVANKQQYSTGNNNLVEINSTKNQAAAIATDEVETDKEILTIEEQIERLQSSINELLTEKKY